MADASYDVVIIGGGAKALPAAIYLAKYGGMEVAIFERRHELGGGLASSEATAPGFIEDNHATNMSAWYFVPLEEDFPDFEEKGGKLVYYDSPLGIITREDQKCCVIYNHIKDPAQEQSAREIARFAGEQDAETYLKLWQYANNPESSYFDAFNQTTYNLPTPPGQQSPLDKWWADYLKQPDCPIDEEWFILPPYKASRLLLENTGLAFMWLRIALAGGVHPVEPMGAKLLAHWILITPQRCFVPGGTHTIAHAYIRIFLENGGRFFTHSHVDKIIIENGTAKGIRLSDGTEIEARKLVLSDVDPHQLCFNLIGNEHLNQRILKKVDNRQGGWGVVMWYNWALHQATRFKAADFNPDIDTTQNIVLGTYDLEVLVREAYLRRLGKNPPIESTIYHHQYCHVDKTRTPKDKHIVLTEQYVAPANTLSEQEWLQLKKQHAEDVVREWQHFTTNMSWDNIIGYDPETPVDQSARLISMGPWGEWGVYNPEPWRPAYAKPIIEFANYRIADIKNLYGTGGAWQSGGACSAGYNVYKAIAEDLGLRKPWEEKGRPF